jgi:type IV secretory pathway TraG/TraD family ATPase VirD4
MAIKLKQLFERWFKSQPATQEFVVDNGLSIIMSANDTTFQVTIQCSVIDSDDEDVYHDKYECFTSDRFTELNQLKDYIFRMSKLQIIQYRYYDHYEKLETNEGWVYEPKGDYHIYKYLLSKK